MPFILETLVTTLNADGSVNLAPQGPIELIRDERYLLRPYQGSRTFENLLRARCGVLHICDDPLLLAQAALGEPDPPPKTRPAKEFAGRVLSAACRYYEFIIEEINTAAERSELTAQVVRKKTVREFGGWNRAQFAVLEATILATRLRFFPPAVVQTELQRLRPLVEKTGGERELAAWSYVEGQIQKFYNPIIPGDGTDTMEHSSPG
ncbi:MAG: DUF447 family protein [Pirellulales bacterium]|nr:DUF447 family protein [Pirellulales bacterium]